MNLSVTEVNVAKEMIACMEVIEKDDRSEMVVDDTTVFS